MLVLLCLTVSGAWAQEETLLTTILNTGDNAGFNGGSKTFDNIATVTFSDYVNNDNDDWGWYSDPEITLTVTAAEGYTITRVKFYTGEGSAFDEEAPFVAILVGPDYIAKVNGNSIGEYGVNKIEVYGYAGTPEPAVTLTDGNDLSGLSTYAGQTVDVTYTRSFTSGKTSTVCLPFAYAKKAADGSFYAFTNIEKVGNEYVATMTEPISTTLTANTPYLYMPTGDVDFSGTYTIPAPLTAGETTRNGWTFKGTYTTIIWSTAPTGTYGFSAADYGGGISQGQFVKVGTDVSIKPMRCYLIYGDGSSDYTGAPGMNRAASAGEQLPETIKVRLINANGELTAIGSLQTKTGEVTLDGDAWYTLDGRRMEGKPSTKGIYISNNKKVIIK